LDKENELRSEISSDLIFSASSKGRQTRIGFSEEYILQYNNRVGESVEQRMTAASHFIASLWYTAWVNAGQPNLSALDLSGCQLDSEILKKDRSTEHDPEHKH